MAKTTYVYKGKKRPESIGVKKTFDSKELTPKTLERLKSMGWEKEKPKAKPKAKKKSKGDK